MLLSSQGIIGLLQDMFCIEDWEQKAVWYKWFEINFVEEASDIVYKRDGISLVM